ncbi:hypothetical protein Pmar_PMAR006193 [Perkinsus marinus ATCC 50983]|uniref:Uncharacterized protein n=1 Tax=Perkinsus marinus (strain ATCC 50983 / TXsc) TaxID=423536 RepID=C5LAE3_PERM5|nr:hypothetical protein Pmar_PMAR006193 [Perkinsus marinus ATCC 50983]EER06399.1 hypothetical protein Pmar_PMAR006193 [Perkinsus marinus ATCC 50983]|eukprot:XP_002774583.1 hypothetical protein Pmar_PMAR006193 [Perkinsus marinus ATCC 50983]
MPARPEAAKPMKRRRVKRSQEAKSRRREKQRYQQRRRNDERVKLDAQLRKLERWAESTRAVWNLNDTIGLTDGTARPGLCPWGIPEGPPTELQCDLREALGRTIDEIEVSEAGRFVARWIQLPREQQGGFDWSAVEKEVEVAAEKLRGEWLASQTLIVTCPV